jgi:hypothetical protein
MVDLARQFRGRTPSRTTRWAAFANEEPPYFHTDEMGSLVYARACKKRGDDVKAMLSSETIGYYTAVSGLSGAGGDGGPGLVGSLGQGYHAVMVTDTAPFRYPHYHTAEDTPDKLDYDNTARVVGLGRVVEDLAYR